MRAEAVYLFRHNLLRDAAYQLQLPGERARLHALALEIMERVLARSTPEALRPFAAELALHARLAAFAMQAEAPQARGAGTRVLMASLPARELHYLAMAARHAESQFRHDDAIEFHDRVAKHALATADTARQAALAAAECCFGAGRITQAAARFREVVRTNPHAPGMAEVRLGALLVECGQSDEATATLQSTLEAAQARGDQRVACEARFQLATIGHRKREFETTQRIYEEVLSAAGKLGLARLEALALGNLAGVHRELDRPGQALACYLKSLELLRQLGALRDEAKTLVNLAGLNFEMGRFDDAARLGVEALAASARAGDRYVWAVALSQVAFRRHMLGEIDPALEELERAQNAAQEIGALSGVLEHIAPLRVMMYAHKATQAGKTPDATWAEKAACTLANLRAEFAKLSIAAAKMHGDALARQQAAVDELQAAIRENRPARLLSGHPPSHLGDILLAALHQRQSRTA